MSAAGVRGLRATYHRVLDRVELLLPEKLRPLYNHPAGNEPRVAPGETSLPVPFLPSRISGQLCQWTVHPQPQPLFLKRICVLSHAPCFSHFLFQHVCALCDLCCTASLRHHSDPDQASWFDPSPFLRPGKGLGTRKPHSLPFPSMSSDILTHAQKSCLTAPECLE